MSHDVNPLVILVASILTNNILLVYFLGMCSFVAVSKKIETAAGLGAAVIFVLTATTPINWLLNHYFLEDNALAWLVGPHLASKVHLGIFALVFFIAVIAGFVQIVELVVERFSPALYYALGIFLPLITVNCAILGGSLFMVEWKFNFMQSIAYGFGAGAGWALAILVMAGLRKRMRISLVPRGLEGMGITMIVTGVMAMAFMAFNGIVPV
ncbi:MAG: NADH:ubiquinone reductase (Na(+)-transporting) subunit E [Deltaproteobacteria bacterium]|nr:NADH:ubiquinone reductase (Na(+)-transporting) subunit E [Deltaproteobacteria bacterium]